MGHRFKCKFRDCEIFTKKKKKKTRRKISGLLGLIKRSYTGQKENYPKKEKNGKSYFIKIKHFPILKCPSKGTCTPNVPEALLTKAIDHEK